MVGEAAKRIIHYFMDEAGNPTLFNRKGRIITGDNGCCLAECFTGRAFASSVSVHL